MVLLLLTILAADPLTPACQLAFSDPVTGESGIFGELTFAQARDVVDFWKRTAPAMRSIIACRGEMRA